MCPHERAKGVVVYLSPWWHRGSGQLASAPARFRFSDLDRLGERVLPGTPVRICCQDLERPRRGSHTWTATGLKAHAGQMDVPPQVPVVVHDRMLNRVILHPKTNTFAGQRNRGMLRYGIQIERSTTESEPAVARLDVLRAADIIRHFERHASDVRMMIASQVRDLYNDQWRNSRSRRSQAEVAGALRVSELTTKHDGSLSLQLLANDLFYGPLARGSARS